MAPGLEGSARRHFDDKDRVPLPPAHVACLTTEVVLVPGAAPCIEIHTQTSWAYYAERLTKAANRGPAEASFARHVLGGARRAKLDGQGRVRIDEELLRWGRIAITQTAETGVREALMMGMGDRVELWNPAVWEERRKVHEEQFESIRAGLFEAGSPAQPGSGGSDEEAR